MQKLLIALQILLAYSFVKPLQRCPRRAINAANAAEDLAALKVADLKLLLKERGLKVSGKKQELIDRLREHAAAEAPPPPPAPTPRITQGSVPDPQLAETIVDLLVTEILEARRSNTTINPDTLASKREALLARGGTALEEVAQRRLAAAPHDTELAGAVALVRGFQRAEFQLRSRDAMREILRAATLGSAQLDDCFEKLSKEGRLDGPFARYVEELEQQQKAKPGDGLLAVWKSKYYGAFVLNRRVVLHAIDAAPARWRGDAGSSALDGISTAASSPRNDAPDALVDFHTGY